MSSVLRVLAWIGRYGTQGFAISIFLGLALPQFAAAARPFLALTIFAFVTMTFIRVDIGALARLVKRPGPVALACLWLVTVPVVAMLAILALVGRENIDPGLLLGLAVFAAAPPIMSAPAVAMMLGLSPTLLIVGVIGLTILSPLLSPLLVEWVAGAAVPLDIWVLVQRLVLLIGGAALTATLIRLVVKRTWIVANARSFDGLGVVMYFVFAIAAMDGVLAAMIETPLRVATYLAIAFGLSLAGFAAAMPALRFLPPSERFVLGYATGQRNMGLIVAALGAATPDTTFLFFALMQFPIYMMPQIVKPVARRLLGNEAVVAKRPPA